MGNRRAKHTIDKDLSFIHGGGAIQSMENKWALMILTDKPSRAKSGHYSNIFLFSYFKNIIDLLGGQINDTLQEKRYSLQFFPATPSSPSRTLKGHFEYFEPAPYKALDLSRALLTELQIYKDTVKCVAPCAKRQVCCTIRKGPRTPSRTADENLDCAVVENALLYKLNFDCEKSTEWN